MNFLAIGQIMTKDIYYFDPVMEETCIKFCNNRKISYLPGLDESKIFRIDNEEVEECVLSEDQMVDVSKNAFDPDLLGKFEKYSVLFVFNANRLDGVIHFSDYDHEQDMLYLYALIMEVEKNLRVIFRKEGFTNNDIYNFFMDHGTNNEYFKKQKEKYETNTDKYATRESFQEFYLCDLIAFANEKKILEIDNEKVNQIRNVIAHSKRIVDHENYCKSEHIYSPESFRKFFEGVLYCQKLHKRIKNYIYLKEICII